MSSSQELLLHASTDAEEGEVQLCPDVLSFFSQRETWGPFSMECTVPSPSTACATGGRTSQGRVKKCQRLPASGWEGALGWPAPRSPTLPVSPALLNLASKMSNFSSKHLHSQYISVLSWSNPTLK